MKSLGGYELDCAMIANQILLIEAVEILGEGYLDLIVKPFTELFKSQ